VSKTPSAARLDLGDMERQRGGFGPSTLGSIGDQGAGKSAMFASSEALFRPRPNALVEALDVCLYRASCIRSREPRSIPPGRFGPCAGTPNSDTVCLSRCADAGGAELTTPI
jgi:hypothetical protein